MTWVEKYRPQTMKEVVGNTKTKEEIQKWIKKWIEEEPQKPLLLLGPPGIGKTTIAHIIGQEAFPEKIEINASDKRSYHIIKNTIGETAQTSSLFHSGKKLIIIDEVDGISGRDDSGGVKAINEMIKNSKQPIILMANDPYSKRLASIKPKCQTIKLRKVHTNTITSTLKRICVKEDIKYEEDAIKQLSKQSNGDLRSAINDLEALTDNSRNITVTDLDILSKKDDINSVFDATRTVLKSMTPQHVQSAMQTDAQPQFLIEVIAENIPREYEKPNEIAKAYEMIALADINLSRAFKRQQYTYWKYAFIFMGRGVANAKKETYKKFSPFANSSVYKLLSKSRGRNNLIETVTTKMGKVLHTSPKQMKEQLVYYTELFQDDEKAYDLANLFKLEESEVKLFRKRKIPKKIEKQRIKEQKEARKQREK
ncbi:MAG: replication factor C large subunit, partial [Methanobacteriaceae archaeon]|nr:replication factor C large subunit [Methanobacteriaceae archaeon]